MKKQIFVALALAAAGCFGSDPNMNSQLFGDAAPPTTTGTAAAAGAARQRDRPDQGIAVRALRHRHRGISAERVSRGPASGQTNLGDPASGATPTLTLRFERGQPRSGIDQGGGAVHGRQPVRRHPEEHDDVAEGLARQDVHVRIKVASGTYPGGAQVYAITVPMQYMFGGTFTNVARTTTGRSSPSTSTAR